MKKLLVITKAPEDATSYYRCLGPLTALAKKGQVELIVTDKPTWPMLRYADLAFFHRPDSPDLYPALEDCKRYNLPVWVDYDDLLLDVPFSNPAYSYYAKSSTKNAIATFAANADFLTVTTQYLADSFKQFHKSPIIIPNAYDDEGPFATKFDAKPDPVIMWRGTKTHDADLHSVLKGIERLTASGVDHSWKLIGEPYFAAVNAMKNVEIFPWKGLGEYFKLLERLRPAVCVVPLENTPFNQAKSNIAWLEATRVGAVTVGPAELPEWKHAQVYFGWGGFCDTVMEAFSMTDEERKDRNLDAWQVIQTNYRLSVVNKQRLAIIGG